VGSCEGWEEEERVGEWDVVGGVEGMREGAMEGVWVGE